MKTILNTTHKTARILILISISLFLVSLTQKGYCTQNNCSDAIILLLLGWFGMLMGGAGISWIANPLIFASWFFTSRGSKYALYTSILSSAACFLFLFFGSVTDNESGQQHQIVSYEWGYWLWCASSLTMLAGNVFLARKLKKISKGNSMNVNNLF